MAIKVSANFSETNTAQRTTDNKKLKIFPSRRFQGQQGIE
jgi:hypothetical protein